MSVNAFYQCAEVVKRLLRYRDFDRLFGRMSRDARKTINMCIGDLERMAAGTKIVGDTNAVHRVVDVLLDRVTREYISPYMRDLCEHCGLLLYNWNQSVENPSNALATKLRAIDRLVKAHYTMLDAINVLRKLVRQPYVPAAYELSRHYLEVIRNEEERNREACPKERSARKAK